MRMSYIIGLVVGILFGYLDYYLFFGRRFFYPGILIAIAIAGIFPLMSFLKGLNDQKQIELKFLEFIRSISGDVRSGIPISKSIFYSKDKDYGVLTPYIDKLASQIEIGIPFHTSFMTFSRDTDNKVIKRAVSIIIEAEQSGGDIANILESVTDSVFSIKKIKQERKANIYTQIVQGYIVFFVFIIIMLVLQLWLFPKLVGIGGGEISLGGASLNSESSFNLDRIFVGLIIIQGFFAGILIGKFSEGTLKQGLIHSIILVMLGLLIVTTAKGSLI
jgi:archaeal flagellar protein FlaJ